MLFYWFHAFIFSVYLSKHKQYFYLQNLLVRRYYDMVTSLIHFKLQILNLWGKNNL